jgi:hypothetical protein
MTNIPRDESGTPLSPPAPHMEPSAGDWRVERDLALTAAYMLLIDGRDSMRVLSHGDFDRMGRVLFHQHEEIKRLRDVVVGLSTGWSKS